jgi:hypothetical protein
VEEVLMSSRIEAGVAPLLARPVELLALAAEEAAKFGVQVAGVTTVVNGDERLLRRLLRNLLENARRYGGETLTVDVQTPKNGGAQIVVSDDGKGVSPSFGCRAMVKQKAALAWAWRWCAKLPNATAGRCGANRANRTARALLSRCRQGRRAPKVCVLAPRGATALPSPRLR